MTEPRTEVTDDQEQNRYEIRLDGELAGVLVYRPLQDAQRLFAHTEVDPAFEGRGVGSRLIAAAIDDSRERGIAVLPQCPFVSAWLGKHPEGLDVVPADQRAAYGMPTT